MVEQRPSIYLFHGDDEFAINQELAKMQSRLGDATTAEMNTTHLDGRSLNLDELVRAARSMPFIAERRLVILTDPLGGLKSQKDRERFKKELTQIPETTALVLVINRSLQGKNGQPHWLQKYLQEQAGRAYQREYALPRGPQMARWIQSKAKERGGEIAYQAADRLSALVGGDPRLAAQEVEKLLAFVNYSRPVEVDDVQYLTPDSAQLEDFALVNALRDGDQRQALGVLHKMLETDDPLQIFGSITYQFRLLLLARTAMDEGLLEQKVVDQLTKHLGVHPYPARLAAQQARQFSLTSLENIYRSLLNFDIAIKSGQVEGDVALDLFITNLTTR
jgi:DNA polymerase-3 subunit delta